MYSAIPQNDAAPRDWGVAGDAVAVAVGWSALAWLSLELSRRPESVATAWFANAWAVALCATAPLSRWPMLLGMVAAGNVALNAAYGDSPVAIVAFVIANLAEIALAAWWLKHLDLAGRFAESPGTYLFTITVGVVSGPLCGAVVGALLLAAAGIEPWPVVLRDWFTGAIIGALAILPPALALRARGWAAAGRALLAPEVIALLVAANAVALIASRHVAHRYIYIELVLTGVAMVLGTFPTLVICATVAISMTAAMSMGGTTIDASAGPLRTFWTFLPIAAVVITPQLLAVARAQQARLSNLLRDEHEQLDALLSASTDLGAIVDRDYRYRTINRAYEMRWKRSRQDLVGRTVESVLSKEAFADIKPLLDRAFKGETLRFHTAIPYPDIGVRTMRVDYHPVFDAAGAVTCVVVTAHDVHDLETARSELETLVAQLRRANTDLEYIVRMSSHDLREPLNTIAQFATLIELDHGDALPPEAREYFEHMRRASARMRDLLDELMQLIRIDRAEESAMAPVPLDTVIADALDALQARIAASGARIDVAPMPTAIGHRASLVLLMQNLIGNALKFVPAGRTPHVRIDATVDRDHAVVTVHDNGVGIAADDAATLFAPFKRLHSRREFEGTGLGLAIGKRIVDLHRGRIWIESSIGEGSRFCVELPCLDASSGGVDAA